VGNESAAGPARLRQLRAAAGLTQEQLAGLAGVHVRTIRGLEGGRVSSPRRPTLTLISRALALDASAQLQFLDAWGLPDQDPLIVGSPSLRAESSVVDEVMSGALASCASFAVSEVVVVDPHRAVVSRRTEDAVLALRDGVNVRYVFYEPDDQSIDVDSLHLRDTENCQVVREIVDPFRRAKVFELALGRTLKVNDSHVMRYTADFAGARTRDPIAARTGQEIGGFFRPPASYVLEVRFDQDARPAQCTQIFQSRPTGPIRTVGILEPSTSNAVHLALINPAPGGHGIRWRW
jgi:transcriptional regulator with XRE-family HTH domain